MGRRIARSTELAVFETTGKIGDCHKRQLRYFFDANLLRPRPLTVP